MTAPKTFKILRIHRSNGDDKIYCRRHNRLFAACPVQENLSSCECLAQCEMSLRRESPNGRRKTDSQ